MGREVVRGGWGDGKSGRLIDREGEGEEEEEKEGRHSS